MADEHTVWTIIVAAGTGSRFGGTTPKQFVEVAGRPIVEWSMRVASSQSDGIVVVTPRAASLQFEQQLTTSIETRVVTGGATRSDSVRAGLAAVPHDADVILVHDAARPVASEALFGRVIQAIRDGADGAIPVVPVIDTVQHIDGTAVDRAMLQAVQTPQGFRASALRAAHYTDSVATDDATLVREFGHAVVGVEGDRWNIKVTDPDDALVVAAVLANRP